LEGDDLAQLLHSAGEKYAFLSCLSLWITYVQLS